MIPGIFKDYYGDDTRWFLGDVVSVDDPIQLGRLQVRIYGVHTSSERLIPNDDLPWAQPLMPITEGGVNGLGINTGIQVGARVFGIFLDGKNSQDPMVFGSLPKYEENAPGGRTTNQLARGTNTLSKSVSVAGAPSDPYAAEYPKNAVHQTSSGHVIEIDDTPSGERIHIHHKSGAFMEFHPDGSLVIKSTNIYIDAGTNANVKADTVDVDANTVNVDAASVNINGGSGDVVVSGISLVNHTHTDTPGLGAGTTSPPK